MFSLNLLLFFHPYLKIQTLVGKGKKGSYRRGYLREFLLEWIVEREIPREDGVTIERTDFLPGVIGCGPGRKQAALILDSSLHSYPSSHLNTDRDTIKIEASNSSPSNLRWKRGMRSL